MKSNDILLQARNPDVKAKVKGRWVYLSLLLKSTRTRVDVIDGPSFTVHQQVDVHDGIEQINSGQLVVARRFSFFGRSVRLSFFP